MCTFTETLRGTVEMYRGAIDRAAWQEFVERISFVPASDDGAELAQAVSAAVADLGGAPCVFYLAVPPSATESVVRMLGTFDLSGPATVVLEKPFGTDLASAERLNAVLHKVFDDDQIYRIDHFLAKEAVQNILALRFANGLFEPVWNHRHVCYVQIDVPEEIDIQGRADFMESTGTLRDMISTHLFQLLGFVALDPPSRFDAESLHHEITKVFRAIRLPDPDRVVFGQYDGYRDEAGVNPVSTVETFVAMEVYVDDWTWIGVPFYSTCGPASRWPRPGAPSRSVSGSPRSRSFPATSTTPATSWYSTSPTTRRSSPMSAARFPGRGSRSAGPGCVSTCWRRSPAPSHWRRTNGCSWTCCAATRPSPSRPRRSSCCGGCSIRCCGIRRDRAAIRGIPGARSRPCDFRGRAAGGCPTRRAGRGLSTRSPHRGLASLTRVPPRYRYRAPPAPAAGPA